MTDVNGRPELLFNRGGWTCAVCGEFVPGNVENHVHDSVKMIAEFRKQIELDSGIIDELGKICVELRSENEQQHELAMAVMQLQDANKRLATQLSAAQQAQAEEQEVKIRCHRLLVAMQMESENVTAAGSEEKAKTMAILKINLMGYVMEIWPNRAAFESDIKILASPAAPCKKVGTE